MKFLAGVVAAVTGNKEEDSAYVDLASLFRGGKFIYPSQTDSQT